MRPSSITDQLFIKANRIRTIQDKGHQEIDEGIGPEFMALLNYSIMGLIQLELGAATEVDMDLENALIQYDRKAVEAKELMIKKNHDYGEAWRDMRISSLTDLILMKINRVKQIEDNEGETLISEGIDSHYFDIINYSNFALIKMEEDRETIS